MDIPPFRKWFQNHIANDSYERVPFAYAQSKPNFVSESVYDATNKIFQVYGRENPEIAEKLFWAKLQGNVRSSRYNKLRDSIDIDADFEHRRYTDEFSEFSKALGSKATDSKKEELFVLYEILHEIGHRELSIDGIFGNRIEDFAYSQDSEQDILLRELPHNFCETFADRYAMSAFLYLDLGKDYGISSSDFSDAIRRSRGLGGLNPIKKDLLEDIKNVHKLSQVKISDQNGLDFSYAEGLVAHMVYPALTKDYDVTDRTKLHNMGDVVEKSFNATQTGFLAQTLNKENLENWGLNYDSNKDTIKLITTNLNSLTAPSCALDIQRRMPCGFDVSPAPKKPLPSL